MPKHDRFTEKEYEKYCGTEMFGRVSNYEYDRGYGFIYTECGCDIFVSSYDLGKLQSKMKLGTTVKFIPVERDGKYVASNVSIVKKMDRGVFNVTDSFSIAFSKIQDFYIASGMDTARKYNINEEELQQHGYSAEVLRHLVIETVKGDTYLFTQSDSPIQVDGQVDDINKVYQELEEIFLKLF